MKTHLLIILFTWGCALPMHSQTIPNPGFENWHLFGGWCPEPDGWQVYHNWHLPIFVVSDTDSHQGKYSMLLASFGSAWSKFAFEKHPANIKAFVKCSFEAIDTVKIYAKVYSNGTLVDQGLWQNHEPIQDWTLITIPISENSSLSDTLEIDISGGTQASTSSIMQVDDLSYDLVNDVRENRQNSSWSLKPNPVKDWTTFTFNCKQGDAYQFLLYDPNSRLVLSIDHITGSPVKIERRDLASGLYFFELFSSDKTVLKGKMIIE